MSHYQRVGDLPPKRHTRHVDADGSRLAEELVGQQGFVGSSSLLYHRHSPSAITAIASLKVDRSCLSANEPLTPWHLRAVDLPAGRDLVTGRHVLAATPTLTLAWVAASGSSPYYRAAAGDELIYLQSGRARLETVFGVLEVHAGDYVVIPASTTHRWILDTDSEVEALIMEAAGHLSIPERYLTSTGQCREGAPFCERDLRPPTEPLIEEGTDVEVLIRTSRGWTRHTHAHHPFDVVGWDGCNYPYALSIHDFEPIVGRIHQPPPVHQTFAGPGFVVCSFVPRLFDFDPHAIKVPYHHVNVDSDEVLFYSSGDFMSRRGAGIGVGSVTIHPAGFVHGPQPGSVEASFGADRTEETAVMIDTFEPLSISATARSVADPAYPWSWAVGR